MNNVDGLDSIEVDLPEGAKQGLKDASQDLKLNTAQMNEQLKMSLPLAVGSKVNKKQDGSSKGIYIENQRMNKPSADIAVENSNVFSPIAD